MDVDVFVDSEDSHEVESEQAEGREILPLISIFGQEADSGPGSKSEGQEFQVGPSRSARRQSEASGSGTSSTHTVRNHRNLFLSSDRATPKPIHLDKDTQHLLSSRSTTPKSNSRTSPYVVPLSAHSPYSASLRSTQSMSGGGSGGNLNEASGVVAAPSTPPMPSSQSFSPSLHSPSQSMSLSNRKPAPAFPASPRGQDANRSGSTGHYTPGTGPTHSPTPFRPVVHHQPITPHSAYHPYRYPSSAPPLSASRIPDQIPILSGQPVLLPSPTRGRFIPHNVPGEWIVNALRKNASKVWYKPSSADCYVYVPVPRTSPSSKSQPRKPPNTNLDVKPNPDSGSASSSNTISSKSSWPSSPIRAMYEASGSLVDNQGTESERDVLIFPLHRDYLTSQSRLLATALSTRPPEPGSPILKGVRRLPTREDGKEAVLVPLPDPGSFGVLVHWFYWGEIQAIETSLQTTDITWQGLFKNIDYLELDDGIKRNMGKWWRRWIKTGSGREALRAGGGERGLGEWYDEDGSEDVGLEGDDEDEGGESMSRGEAGAGIGGMEGEEVAGMLERL